MEVKLYKRNWSMCEIVIRITEHQHSTAETAGVHLQPGDIVDVQDNGWQWTTNELNNPDWRFVSLPTLSKDQMNFMTSSDKTDSLLRKRKWTVSLNTISDIITSWEIGKVNSVSLVDRVRFLKARIQRT